MLWKLREISTTWGYLRMIAKSELARSKIGRLLSTGVVWENETFFVVDLQLIECWVVRIQNLYKNLSNQSEEPKSSSYRGYYVEEQEDLGSISAVAKYFFSHQVEVSNSTVAQSVEHPFEVSESDATLQTWVRNTQRHRSKGNKYQPQNLDLDISARFRNIAKKTENLLIKNCLILLHSDGQNKKELI